MLCKFFLLFLSTPFGCLDPKNPQLSPGHIPHSCAGGENWERSTKDSLGTHSQFVFYPYCFLSCAIKLSTTSLCYRNFTFNIHTLCSLIISSSPTRVTLVISNSSQVFFIVSTISLNSDNSP